MTNRGNRQVRAAVFISALSAATGCPSNAAAESTCVVSSHDMKKFLDRARFFRYPEKPQRVAPVKTQQNTVIHQPRR